jgi:hypothetical protein
MKSFKPYKPIPPFKVMKPYLLMALPAVVVFCVILFLPRDRISPRFERTLATYPQIYQERYDQEVTILSQDTTAASTTTVFSTGSTMAEVFAWYETMYPAHGWIDRTDSASDEEERLTRSWEYLVDGLCSLSVRIEYTPSTQTYTHTIHFIGKSC